MYSLLQELSRRGGLRIAVSGRSEEQLLPLLQYLCKSVHHHYYDMVPLTKKNTHRFMLNPRYSTFLSDVLLLILGELSS